jgi:3',5'-cyclic AMP phosphodiesterase CpdA
MLKILIISDLHAFTPRDEESPATSPPSFFVNSEVEGERRPNPLEAIPELLRAENLDVDWVLCPGDIADRADPNAQTFAWRHLVQLNKNVKARLLLGTAGNHDIDSRFKFSNFDPKGHLQALTPSFPGTNVADRYWARNFHILEDKSVRLLNLNSAAFHGYHSKEALSKPEYLQGRVSDQTQEIADKQFQLNILFTHHHPFRNDDIYDDDYSEMQMGGKLVAMLSEQTASSWLIIHGHQHYPALRYGPGAVHQPVIFSAGSATATLRSPLSAEAPNQFYHLTLTSRGVHTKNWSPCGVVRAWHWARRRQWERSPSEYNIPDGTGFGCRENVITIASEIAQTVRSGTASVGEMTKILDVHPHLQFITKPTMDQIIAELPSHGIKCTQGLRFQDSNFRRVES